MKLLLLFLLPIIAVLGSEMDVIVPLWSMNKIPPFKAAQVSKERFAEWSEKVTVNWITQPVDHFNPADTRTYQQRYLKNEEHFRAGGPIIIFVGGEWSVEFPGMDILLDIGTTYEIAAENNGLLLYPEHRYYGESQPFNDTRTESLRFLTIEQAIEDLARFVRFIKASDPRFTNSKVIITGASYSAMLTSFFRTKYPELSAGAWASSAPTETRSEALEYKVLSGQAIAKYGSQQCYNRFQEGYARIETFLDQRNVAPIEAAFKLCDGLNINDWRSVQHFLNIIASLPASHVAGIDPDGIVAMCDVALRESDPLLGVAAVFNEIVLPVNCFQTDYQAYVNFLRHEELEHPANSNGIRTWIYQTCTDVGLYQTSASPNQPFGRKLGLDIYLEFCKDVFGFQPFTRATLDASTAKVNSIFGGLTPNVRRIFYTHGEIDAWKTTGIQETLNPDATVFTIPGASHCTDIFPGWDDKPNVQIARNQAKILIRGWLQ